MESRQVVRIAPHTETARDGETEAFERLFLTCYPDLCRFANTIVHNPDTAEDLVQDVFARVWNRWDALVGQEQIRAYLYTATRNECLLHIRRARVARQWQQDATAGDRSNVMGAGPLPPDTQAETNELAAALARVLQKLPDRCRQTFVLRRQHGLGPQEIAQIMGVSVKTVEAQLNKALRAMREQLYGVRTQ